MSFLKGFRCVSVGSKVLKFSIFCCFLLNSFLLVRSADKDETNSLQNIIKFVNSNEEIPTDIQQSLFNQNSLAENAKPFSPRKEEGTAIKDEKKKDYESIDILSSSSSSSYFSSSSFSSSSSSPPPFMDPLYQSNCIDDISISDAIEEVSSIGDESSLEESNEHLKILHDLTYSVRDKIPGVKRRRGSGYGETGRGMRRTEEKEPQNEIQKETISRGRGGIRGRGRGRGIGIGTGRGKGRGRGASIDSGKGRERGGRNQLEFEQNELTKGNIGEINNKGQYNKMKKDNEEKGKRKRGRGRGGTELGRGRGRGRGRGYKRNISYNSDSEEEGENEIKIKKCRNYNSTDCEHSYYMIMSPTCTDEKQESLQTDLNIKKKSRKNTDTKKQESLQTDVNIKKKSRKNTDTKKQESLTSTVVNKEKESQNNTDTEKQESSLTSDTNKKESTKISVQEKKVFLSTPVHFNSTFQDNFIRFFSMSENNFMFELSQYSNKLCDIIYGHKAENGYNKLETFNMLNNFFLRLYHNRDHLELSSFGKSSLALDKLYSFLSANSDNFVNGENVSNVFDIIESHEMMFLYASMFSIRKNTLFVRSFNKTRISLIKRKRILNDMKKALQKENSSPWDIWTASNLATTNVGSRVMEMCRTLNEFVFNVEANLNSTQGIIFKRYRNNIREKIHNFKVDSCSLRCLLGNFIEKGMEGRLNSFNMCCKKTYSGFNSVITELESAIIKLRAFLTKYYGEILLLRFLHNKMAKIIVKRLINEVKPTSEAAVITFAFMNLLNSLNTMVGKYNINDTSDNSFRNNPLVKNNMLTYVTVIYMELHLAYTLYTHIRTHLNILYDILDTIFKTEDLTQEQKKELFKEAHDKTEEIYNLAFITQALFKNDMNDGYAKSMIKLSNALTNINNDTSGIHNIYINIKEGLTDPIKGYTDMKSLLEKVYKEYLNLYELLDFSIDESPGEVTAINGEDDKLEENSTS